MKNKFSESDIELLKKLTGQDYKTIFQEIREQDYNLKKWLIDTIDWYKASYKKSGKQIDKDIIEGLLTQLSQVNNMIATLDKLIKDI